MAPHSQGADAGSERPAHFICWRYEAACLEGDLDSEAPEEYRLPYLRCELNAIRNLKVPRLKLNMLGSASCSNQTGHLDRSIGCAFGIDGVNLYD
jgi:hypothetical protein